MTALCTCEIIQNSCKCAVMANNLWGRRPTDFCLWAIASTKWAPMVADILLRVELKTDMSQFTIEMFNLKMLSFYPRRTDTLGVGPPGQPGQSTPIKMLRGKRRLYCFAPIFLFLFFTLYMPKSLEIYCTFLIIFSASCMGTFPIPFCGSIPAIPCWGLPCSSSPPL